MLYWVLGLSLVAGALDAGRIDSGTFSGLPGVWAIKAMIKSGAPALKTGLLRRLHLRLCIASKTVLQVQGRVYFSL